VEVSERFLFAIPGPAVFHDKLGKFEMPCGHFRPADGEDVLHIWFDGAETREEVQARIDKWCAERRISDEEMAGKRFEPEWAK
jgi:hypothetical protein